MADKQSLAQLNNQVPKEVVDNIMKTYENIINQHLKSMEQISNSVKELSTACAESDLETIKYFDNKVKEIIDEFKKSTEEKKVAIKELESTLTGPTPDYTTNLQGVNDHILENNKLLKDITNTLRGIKIKLIVYATIITVIVGSTAMIYGLIQRSNDEYIKRSVTGTLVEIMKGVPAFTEGEFNALDKNKDGVVSSEEFKAHK